MKAISNNVMLLRLTGTWLACWVVPPLLCHFAGAAIGAVGASGALAFWFSQYRLPVWSSQGASTFLFVAVGYVVIGITWVVCMSRLTGLGF